MLSKNRIADSSSRIAPKPRPSKRNWSSSRSNPRSSKRGAAPRAAARSIYLRYTSCASILSTSAASTREMPILSARLAGSRMQRFVPSGGLKRRVRKDTRCSSMRWAAVETNSGLSPSSLGEGSWGWAAGNEEPESRHRGQSACRS